MHQTDDGMSLLAAGSRPPRPMHVVNLALNLVRGDNLAWQQRKADSFTVSPLHSGFRKGYRPTVDYGVGSPSAPPSQYPVLQPVPTWAITPHRQ
jgi:hypothetical protein